MYTPSYLEFETAVIALLDIILLVWFSIYMYRIWSESETKLANWLSRGPPARFQAALSIFIYHLGDLFVRGNLYIWRHERLIGRNTEWISRWPLVLGGFIIICGIIYQLRVFSRPVGVFIWIWAALICIFLGWLSLKIPF